MKCFVQYWQSSTWMVWFSDFDSIEFFYLLFDRSRKISSCMRWIINDFPCSKMFNFNVGTPNGVHLFDHHLWSIFQSSIHDLQILTVSLWPLWAAYKYCINTYPLTCGYSSSCILCSCVFLEPSFTVGCRGFSQCCSLLFT